MSIRVLTIGHSNGTLEHLLSILRMHGVRTVIDVRTKPGSLYVPQFNREVLESQLSNLGIRYRFRGDVLGGHPEDPSLYHSDGRVNFAMVEQQPDFQRALKRLMTGEYEVPALLCKEADPLDCPRFFLLGRLLALGGAQVEHIGHADGSLEMHTDAEDRMLKEMKLNVPSLFASNEQTLLEGYALLMRKYEYRAPWKNKSR